MDVHCLNCQEPWDTYHLRHDAIYDAIYDGGLWSDIRDESLDGKDAQKMVQKRWPKQELTEEVRQGFRAVGWEFGASILVVLHCPSCRANAKAVDDATRVKVETLGALLKGDTDGLAAELDDLK